MSYHSSLLSKIGDDGDDKGYDGEYSTNVGYPSEGKRYWRRFSWRTGVEILG